MKNTIVAALTALTLTTVGCSNQTLTPANEAHGNGTVSKPYVINRNGLFNTSKNSVYKTNPLQVNCHLVVKSTDTELWYVRLYNQAGAEVQPIVRDKYWEFVVPEYSVYEVNTFAYTNTKIKVFSSCLFR